MSEWDDVFAEVKRQYVYRPYCPKVKRPVASEQSKPFMGGLLTDIPEEFEVIRGWRAWRPGSVAHHDDGDGRLLRSVTMTTEWGQRDIVGECWNKRRSRGKKQKSLLCTEHLLKFVPGPWQERWCTCGLHTLKSLRNLPSYAQPSFDALGRLRWPYIVLGGCLVYGTMVETRLGYLSDRARIEALYVCPGIGMEFTDQMYVDAELYARQFGVSVEVKRQGDLY